MKGVPSGNIEQPQKDKAIGQNPVIRKQGLYHWMHYLIRLSHMGYNSIDQEIQSYVDNQVESHKVANEKASSEIEKLKAKIIPFRFKGNVRGTCDFQSFNTRSIGKKQRNLLPLAVVRPQSLRRPKIELKQRNKLVKLKSLKRVGLLWTKYLADYLAENGEDDKKICSPQARAAARKKTSGVKSTQKSKAILYQARRPVASLANPAYMANYTNNNCSWQNA